MAEKNQVTAEKNQGTPSTLVDHHIMSIDEDDKFPTSEPKERRHRHYVKCCGCITALVLVLAVIMLVLFFTVLHFKDPMLKLNSLTIIGLDRVSNVTLRPGSIVTVTADVSIKNPNVASFRFGSATITVCYRDVAVGEGGHPPGAAKARGTLRMNVTVDVTAEKIFDVPRFESDRRAGSLPMSSYSSVSGTVNMLNAMKRHFEVKMNCTMAYNITTQGIQDEACNAFLAL